mmetsp:Transcript_2612/g.3841  ORF Transcript_2612/g.3841 Transcript_2612/m.3841 type:complete len:207 (-) Transcript_2612:75-695(-)
MLIPMHHLNTGTTMASSPPRTLFFPMMSKKVISSEPSVHHTPFTLDQHVDNSSYDLHYMENCQQWPAAISSSPPLSSNINASYSSPCANSREREMATSQTQANESFRIFVKREVLNSDNPLQCDPNGGLGQHHSKLHKRRRYQRRNSVTASILLRQLSGNEREEGAQLGSFNHSSLSRTRKCEDEFLNTATERKESSTKRRRMSLS